MAFGFGKKWLKRASGASNLQCQVSKKIGINLSGRRSSKASGCLVFLSPFLCLSPIVACLSLPVMAAPEVKYLVPWEMKIGDEGLLPNSSDIWVQVVTISKSKGYVVATIKLVSRGDKEEFNPRIFFIDGIETKDLVDGKRLELKGKFKVESIEENNGRRFFLIKPVK